MIIRMIVAFLVFYSVYNIIWKFYKIMANYKYIVL